MSFNYHLENIQNRLSQLLKVLQYDTEVFPIFTVWERMMINQERAAMMDYINYLFQELEFDKVRMFTVPGQLEEKIKYVAKNIELKNWQPKPKED